RQAHQDGGGDDPAQRAVAAVDAPQDAQRLHMALDARLVGRLVWHWRRHTGHAVRWNWNRILIGVRSRIGRRSLHPRATPRTEGVLRRRIPAGLTDHHNLPQAWSSKYGYVPPARLVPCGPRGPSCRQPGASPFKGVMKKARG